MSAAAAAYGAFISLFWIFKCCVNVDQFWGIVVTRMNIVVFIGSTIVVWSDILLINKKETMNFTESVNSSF